LKVVGVKTVWHFFHDAFLLSICPPKQETFFIPLFPWSNGIPSDLDWIKESHDKGIWDVKYVKEDPWNDS